MLICVPSVGWNESAEVGEWLPKLLGIGGPLQKAPFLEVAFLCAQLCKPFFSKLTPFKAQSCCHAELVG